MRAKMLLRIAVVLIAIHLLGHSFGHSNWDRPEDPKMLAVVSTMKSYSAGFMGATKSMGDYYHGYSLMILGLYGLTIVILWFASGFVNSQPAIAKKILYPIGITYLIFGVIEYVYFFPFAASMSFLAGILCVAALIFKGPVRQGDLSDRAAT